MKYIVLVIIIIIIINTPRRRRSHQKPNSTQSNFSDRDQRVIPLKHHIVLPKLRLRRIITSERGYNSIRGLSPACQSVCLLCFMPF